MSSLSLRASCYGREATIATARVVDFERSERLRRAAAIFFPLLAAALLSLPIPGWHIAAVPGFTIAAFVLGRRRLRQECSIESLTCPCPACEQPQDLKPPDPPQFPVTIPCPGCGEFLKLEQAGGPSAGVCNC